MIDIPQPFNAIKSEGLVLSAPFVSTWMDQVGTMVTYYRPEDCRWGATRIKVLALNTNEGPNTSNVNLCTGTGTSFETIRRIDLPANPSPELVLEAVEVLKEQFLALPMPTEAAAEREAALLLIENGFRYDDFWFQTAWVKASGKEYIDLFVRGVPEAHFAHMPGGDQMALTLNDEVDNPNAPCQVGYCHEDGVTMTTVVAPDLYSAMRLLQDGLLPMPTKMGGEEVFSFDALMPSSSFRHG